MRQVSGLKSGSEKRVRRDGPSDSKPRCGKGRFLSSAAIQATACLSRQQAQMQKSDFLDRQDNKPRCGHARFPRLVAYWPCRQRSEPWKWPFLGPIGCPDRMPGSSDRCGGGHLTPAFGHQRFNVAAINTRQAPAPHISTLMAPNLLPELCDLATTPLQAPRARHLPRLPRPRAPGFQCCGGCV